VSRAPFVPAVSRAGFRTFVTSAPIVVVRVGPRYALWVAPAVARHFLDEHPGHVRIGVFDRAQVASRRWLVRQVAPLIAAAEAPDGYYLFRDGEAVAFHPVRLLGLDPRTARAVIDAFEEVLAEPPSGDPYAVLGVAATATDAEVKAAWRKAMTLNHPDRVAHLSARIQEVARDETRVADEAYRQILTLRRR
jgi:hypothetical protein